MGKWSRALLVGLVAAACTRSAEPGPAGTVSSTVGAVPPSGTTGSSPGPSVPAPDRAIPTDPAELAQALTSVTQTLYASIDRWVASGTTGEWPPPDELVLQALYQQRITRTLAASPKLAERVIPLLPRPVRGEVRANVAAGAALLSNLRPPSHRISLTTGPPRPPKELLRYYRFAQKEFHVDWEVLAAVNFIESRFGRVRSSSAAGARGPMQFLASTWRAYGLGGNVRDPRQAIIGAANYLHQSGAPGDYRGALYAYNPLRTYVKAVLLYARRMDRDPRSFYAYYNWQVFVLTPDGGSERLTGPGL